MSAPMAISAPAPLPTPEECRRLCATLIESISSPGRRLAAHLVALAVFCQENVLFLAPPRLGQRDIARRLCDVLSPVGAYYERVSSRPALIGEHQGYPSAASSQRDPNNLTIACGELMEAQVAYLEEVPWADATIANALLKLVSDVPNSSVEPRVAPVIVASSSRILSETEISLGDRFLLHHHLQPVTDAEILMQLIDTIGPREATPRFLDVAGAARLTREACSSVRIPSPVRTLLALFAQALRQDFPAISVSDSRWMQIGRLLRVAAFMNGRCVVHLTDCWLLQFCVGAPATKDACAALAHRLENMILTARGARESRDAMERFIAEVDQNVWIPRPFESSPPHEVPFADLRNEVSTPAEPFFLHDVERDIFLKIHDNTLYWRLPAEAEWRPCEGIKGDWRAGRWYCRGDNKYFRMATPAEQTKSCEWTEVKNGVRIFNFITRQLPAAS